MGASFPKLSLWSKLGLAVIRLIKKTPSDARVATYTKAPAALATGAPISPRTSEFAFQ